MVLNELFGVRSWDILFPVMSPGCDRKSIDIVVAKNNFLHQCNFYHKLLGTLETIIRQCYVHTFGLLALVGVHLTDTFTFLNAKIKRGHLDDQESSKTKCLTSERGIGFKNTSTVSCKQTRQERVKKPLTDLVNPDKAANKIAASCDYNCIDTVLPVVASSSAFSSRPTFKTTLGSSHTERPVPSDSIHRYETVLKESVCNYFAQCKQTNQAADVSESISTALGVSRSLENSSSLSDNHSSPKVSSVSSSTSSSFTMKRQQHSGRPISRVFAVFLYFLCTTSFLVHEVTACYKFPPGVRDPCEGHVCKFGAECMSSMDGKIARCQCPDECPSYGDNVGSKPVCGNDGNDYANMCELRKAACYRLEDIRVKYYGKCDPCEGFTCESPKVCQVNAEREPECHCSYVCPTEINLVCGTDGRTYSNQCLLRKQACKSRRDIKVLYNGKCTPDNNPCSQIRCGPEEECSVGRSGEAVCVCPPPCEPVLRRVCGNDSTTYDNECELRRRSCLEKVYVTVKHPGPCGTDSVCHGHYCDYGAICVEHNDRPVCECPQCTEEYKPVCGENDITYENECKLRQENCFREENIQVKKEGPCGDGCGQQRCEFYAVCETLSGQPRCVCPTSCVKVDAPVCGNDGVTYENECQLRVESCRRKKFLTIASTGTCDKCKGVTCEFNAKCENGICVCPILCPTVHEPVCGSDDRTYVNECEMRKYSCAQSIFIEVAKVGECEGDFISGSGDFSGDGERVDDDDDDRVTPPKKCTQDNCVKYGGTCELDGLQYKCSCRFTCEAVRQPVCGSDGRTYGNQCTMLHQSCIRKQVITEQPMENCDEFDEQEACDGATPLINPATGNDYDCTPGHDSCPAHSYCHITLQFSKCCKDESAPIRQCSETTYGCCKDGKTPANGPRGGGCPEVCHCNPIGSYSTTCDPRTRQCTCKPGVGGKRCDRCDIGYWGLHKIGESGNAGCIPCNCNKFGSHRDDCDQMTGRCMCKPLIMGMKCDMCRNGKMLGPDGCRDQFLPDSCDDLMCGFGATCREEEDGNPVCVCEHDCDASSQMSEIVCGTDGQNYGSRCQLELFGCRLQKDIMVAHTGACKAPPPTPITTPSPVTKSRKTTRDIDETEDEYPENNNNNNKNDNKGQPPAEEERCTGSNIDELCLSDDDCCPDFSHCKNGLCYCYEGYIPSIDNSKCYEVKTKPTEKVDNTTNACTTNPCLDGQCILDEMLGYRCSCPLGKAGSRCELKNKFTVPSFSGRSYLELPRINKASQDMSIEIIFSTLNKDGIILFNARHKNGSGDFVSLAMRDGFVEFRYDLGGGPAILRSREPVEPIRSHRVIARRMKEVGILIVDSEETVTGSSPSTHSSLDLNDPLLLGYIPSGTKETYEKVGVQLGLVGCIHLLAAGSRDDMYTYNLALDDIYTDVIDGIDITECGSNPCKSMPCRNGATCLVLDTQIFECRCRAGYKGILCEELVDPCASQPCQYGGTCLPMTSSDGFFCQCAHGREGSRCEKESMPEVFVPQFTGDSYMEMPLEEKLSQSLSITVWFKSMKPDGVLLFVTQNPGGGGDFISLNLEDKKLVFTYFLGSGVGQIESKKHIHLDKWHEVTIRRNGRIGEMSIDGHAPVTGESLGKSSELNIDNRPMFLGGFRKKEDLPTRANIQNGFTGAIQRIIINGRTIDGLMSSAVTMRNISTYNGPPCNVNPCMNGGVCVPMLNLAECRCPANYMGDRCEKKYEQVDRDQPVKFDGMTYLSFPNEISRKQEGQQSNRFSVKFRTTEADGIILLQTGGDTVSSDYLSLSVSGGQVQLSYNLGKHGPGNLFIIRSSVRVNDGRWHTAKVSRQQRAGSLQVDEEDPVMDSSDQGTQQLDTDGLLWVGGRNNLPWGLPTMKNFNGCIESVEVNGQPLHLVEDKNGHSTTISFCT